MTSVEAGSKAIIALSFFTLMLMSDEQTDVRTRVDGGQIFREYINYYAILC